MHQKLQQSTFCMNGIIISPFNKVEMFQTRLFMTGYSVSSDDDWLVGQSSPYMYVFVAGVHLEASFILVAHSPISFGAELLSM
jgi:hypothetical protein